MAAVAALAICLGGWMLTQMVVEYHLAGRVERSVDIDALLFAALDKIGFERPVVGDALLADAPADAALLAKVAAARQDTDDALTQVERRIASLSYPGAAAQMAIVRQTRTDLAKWRVIADTPLILPKSRRDPTIFNRYVVGLNAVFEATSVALDVGDMLAALHDGTVAELITLSRHALTTRGLIGARTLPLMTAIDEAVKLDPAALAVQARFGGMFATNWQPIMALSRRLSNMPDLVATIEAARKASDDYESMCQDVIAAGRSGTNYPISAYNLGRNGLHAVSFQLRIRDEALSIARSRVLQSRQSAMVDVVIAAVVLLFTFIAMAGVLMLLQRRIVSPVLALTAVIGKIARHEFDVAIPAQDRHDEIGHMAVALGALHRGAIAGEENKARITHLARHDPLTGLLNRLAMQDSLEHAVARAGRGQTTAALCLDLDRFKAVNDTFGHPTGDLLLKAVAGRLLACVRDVDIVSRLGGDEFVVLLVALDHPDDAAMVAQRIVRALSEPFDLDGQTASIGCSIGIAITPRDATAGIALLKRADTALYRAKQEEKGSWRFFKAEMDEHLQERMALEHDLRDAVRNDAFELAYQPQYTIATGRLCGFEALVRWRHPERGLLGPSAFIPIAEEAGLIVPIGAWVLRHACAEATNWPDDLKLAVNLSGVQFKNHTLVETVRQAVADAGLPATRLELEITETILLGNSASHFAILHELREMGVQIAMDDFGTGYSSLSYLRSFPFTKIKIDQSFIRDLSERSESRAIVRTIVALASSLGMTTTAEGVETEDQLAVLRREGITDVQGYLFSKPIWAEEARLLAAETAIV